MSFMAHLWGSRSHASVLWIRPISWQPQVKPTRDACPKKNVTKTPYLKGTSNQRNANGDALPSPHVDLH